MYHTPLPYNQNSTWLQCTFSGYFYTCWFNLVEMTPVFTLMGHGALTFSTLLHILCNTGLIGFIREDTQQLEMNWSINHTLSGNS